MKVAVLADCHVDHGVHQRWASTAWKRATTDIANETFDVCVVAGDLFHTGKPVSEAVMVCVDGLKTMTAAGVQVLVVAGNHEWIRVRSRDAHRPPCSGRRNTNKTICSDQTQTYKPLVLGCGCCSYGNAVAATTTRFVCVVASRCCWGCCCLFPGRV